MTKVKEDKDIDYWRLNAQEDFINTPISVLRYITELENLIDKEVDDEINTLKRGLEKIAQYAIEPTGETKMQRIKRLKSVAEKALWRHELLTQSNKEG